MSAEQVLTQHFNGKNYSRNNGTDTTIQQNSAPEILLENYYLPGDLEARIGDFIANYNHCRYHESLGNLTPADVYFGRGQTILIERERIKRQTIATRRLMHRQRAA
jgi:transposase InsO family protein